MSFEQTLLDVTAVFDAAWTVAHPAIPIRYENMSFTPPAGAPWVALDILDANRDIATIARAGENTYRQVGVIQVSIFTPKDGGSALGRQLADDVEGIFRAASVVAMRFLAARIRTLGVESTQSYWQVAVSIPFERDDLL
jgi:hypothetical protein